MIPTIEQIEQFANEFYEKHGKKGFTYLTPEEAKEKERLQ